MKRGRPREFDPDATLDQALIVFRRDGFESASVQTLADAMGICKPSLYAAYGNKEALFIAAVRRYSEQGRTRQRAILDAEPDARRAVQLLMDDVVTSYAACRAHAGCLVVAETAGTAESQSDAVRDVLSSALGDTRDVLRARLRRAHDEGGLPPHFDADEFASYLGTLIAGLSVQAKAGATVESMRAVVSTAMRAWPLSTKGT